ncbi:MAG: phage holin family protein [Chloroflexi bacterium]|nr:phage holin family protein [Chloroflexota bacterium]
MAQQLPPTDRQSTTQLFRRIVNGVNGLVDRHVQLVKQELKEELLVAVGAAKTLIIGAAIGIVGALILLNVVVMILVLGLNELGGMFIPIIGPWLGWIVAFILLGVVFFITYKLVMRGIEEFKISPVERTRKTVQEDIEWAQQLLTRNGK